MADQNRSRKELVDELRSELALQPGGSFERALEKQKLSTEKFVIAFFSVVAPYAEMLVELLRLFEFVRAKKTDSNVVIEFDFDSDTANLRFDLEHFRDSLTTWRRIWRICVANQWTIDQLWSLCGTFPYQISASPAVQRWSNNYENGNWTAEPPPVPRSGQTQLDERLLRIWNLWEEINAECLRYGSGPTELRAVATEHESQRGILDETDDNSMSDGDERWIAERWPANFLWHLESDRWRYTIANAAHATAENIHEMTIGKISETIDAIDEVFSGVKAEESKFTDYVQNIKDVLNLPIWKMRHELYSAWMFTQIVASMPDLPYRVHTANDAIMFSFSGSHLATVDMMSPNLHVWCELRSALANPRGKGRKRQIQPDYSIVADPITSPSSSVFEVECKQYLRPSARNFSDALTDYANGRPNAHVVLVNYGPADNSILDRVDPSVRERTSLIGHMRPGRIDSCEQFKQILRQSLASRLGDLAPESLSRMRRKFELDLGDGGTAILTWKEAPKDLDLHVAIQNETGDSSICCYQSRGTPDYFPFVVLNQDIQNGHGPEEVSITQWLPGQYIFAVHNYSNETPLSESRATLVVKIGSTKIDFQCPNVGTGQWWHVCSVDVNSGVLERIDRIRETIPWEHFVG